MLFSALLAAAVLSAGSRPALPQNTSQTTSEGTEILRRILVDDLEEAFNDSEQGLAKLRQNGQELGFVTTLWSSHRTVQNARAFHVPGAGLFFAMDVSLPMVKKESPDEPENSDQPGDDEWERARREVRGRLSSDGFLVQRLRLESPVATEIAPEAIERTTDVVLRTLARHALRVEGLEGRETITVALRLSGKSRTWMHDFESSTNHGLEVPGLLERGARKTSESQEGETISAYVFATAAGAPEQTLTLQIPVSALAGLAEAGVGELRQRARINRY